MTSYIEDEEIFDKLYSYLVDTYWEKCRYPFGRYSTKTLSPISIKADLKPNPKLSKPDQELQFKLLEVIEEFADIAANLIMLEKFDKFKIMLAEAMEASIKQCLITNQE